MDTDPKSGQARFRVRINGKPEQIKQWVNESNTAFLQRVAKLRKRAQAAHGRIPSISFNDLIDVYIESAELGDGTRSLYRLLYENHIKAMRVTGFAADVEAKRIKAQLAWLRQQPRVVEKIAKVRTDDIIHKCYKLIRAAYNWGAIEGHVTENPAENLRIKAAKKKEVPYVPVDQIPQFLAAASTIDEMAHRVFYTAIATGARFSEIADLDWKDVDFAKSVIHYRGTKTDAADRSVVMTERLSAALKKWRGDRIAGRVFTNTEGGRLKKENVLRRWVKEAGKAIKVPTLTFHALRHTAAAALFTLGFDENQIKGRFGWAQMPATYKHYDLRMQQEIAQKLHAEGL